MKPTDDALSFLDDELAALDARGLRRRPAAPPADGAISFCSNDYLGLADRSASPSASGAGASRLLGGEREEHRRAEKAFASWLGAEDALLFTSGYAANVGTVAALAAPGDLVVSDALNHASLIDGARLSRARVAIVPHGDVAEVERALARRSEARAWVLVESYYSMDADGPDLAALRAACDAGRAALIVDEAHALGVLGPAGRGRCAEQGVRADALIGTLGKSFGSQGAFVAGRRQLRDWLWNRARSFVFSTGLAPVSAAASVRALATLVASPELPAIVRDRAIALREGLTAAGARPLGFGHVVPVVLGEPSRAERVAAELAQEGIVVPAIRPPTVPVGTSRLRFTVTAVHSPADVERAVRAFGRALARAGGP